MAIIISSEKTNYTGGSIEDSSHIVGYADSKNRVVRYTFKTDSYGASSVSWYLKKNYLVTSSAPSLRWYIGTNATSHVNAGVSTTEYSGDVTVTNNQGTYEFSGEADIVLMPNTTYYLWIFPNTTSFRYYNTTELIQAEITSSGSAGLIYIDNGNSFDAYQVYIDNGYSWDLYIPYIDNGSDWDMCS